MSRLEELEQEMRKLRADLDYELDSAALSRNGYVPLSLVIDLFREVDSILRTQVGVGLNVASLRRLMRQKPHPTTQHGLADQDHYPVKKP